MQVKKELFLVVVSAFLTIIVTLVLVRWFAPQLLGIPVNLQMVQVSKEVPPFFDNVFRHEDFASENFIISDPYIVRPQPLMHFFFRMGPNDLLGFRNRNIPIAADIITIGDSQTYGNSVYIEQNWPSSMLADMQDNLPVLYNMSAGGWGATEYFEIFNKALYMQPKVVIIAFYSGNDPIDTFQKVYGDKRWKDLRLDSDLKASDAPGIPERNEWAVDFKDGQKAVFTPGYRYIANEDNPVVRAGYDIMAKIAGKIGEIARLSKVNLIFTIIPTKEFVFKKKIDQENIILDKKYAALVAQEELNIEGLAKVLQGIPGATYVDVIEPLQDAVLNTVKIYSRDNDGHPFAGGYQVIGSVLAESAKKLLPEKPRGAVYLQIAKDKFGLFLVKDNKLWTFSSDKIAEENGWTNDLLRNVELRDVANIPYGGVIQDADPSRFGPQAF